MFNELVACFRRTNSEQLESLVEFCRVRHAKALDPVTPALREKNRASIRFANIDKRNRDLKRLKLSSNFFGSTILVYTNHKT